MGWKLISASGIESDAMPIIAWPDTTKEGLPSTIRNIIWHVVWGSEEDLPIPDLVKAAGIEPTLCMVGQLAKILVEDGGYKPSKEAPFLVNKQGRKIDILEAVHNITPETLEEMIGQLEFPFNKDKLSCN